MISKETFKFLSDLKKHNDRDWFQKNKPRYEAAKEEFEIFVGELINELAKFDKDIRDIEAKKCIFRIYRDVRFSKDKSPYKTHFGAHIVAGGKKNEHNRAGYYIHVAPGDSMLAGGAYMPPADWLKAIRQEIDYNTKAFKKIISEKKFVKYFGGLEGEQLKNAPKEYPKDHPEIELLKYKSYLATHHLKDKEVLDKSFKKHTVEVFKAYKPFCDFLNRSME